MSTTISIGFIVNGNRFWNFNFITIANFNIFTSRYWNFVLCKLVTCNLSFILINILYIYTIIIIRNSKCWKTICRNSYFLDFIFRCCINLSITICIFCCHIYNICNLTFIVFFKMKDCNIQVLCTVKPLCIIHCLYCIFCNHRLLVIHCDFDISVWFHLVSVCIYECNIVSKESGNIITFIFGFFF